MPFVELWKSRRVVVPSKTHRDERTEFVLLEQFAGQGALARAVTYAVQEAGPGDYRLVNGRKQWDLSVLEDCTIILAESDLEPLIREMRDAPLLGDASLQSHWLSPISN